MKTILLKFAGPLQSWGSSSHFESRHTDPHPSKSAVIGMIAAAFGYRRDCTDKITALNKLHFAVRADQVGDIKEDYQTAHKYKFNPDKTLERTYVTHRYYLEDAVFVAAVGHEDDVWMDRIVQALRHPYFQLYMGRRSYPIPADCILGTVQTDVLSALQQEPWQAAAWYRRCHSGQLDIYADADLLQQSSITYRKDNIVSLSLQEGRQYQLREERSLRIRVSASEDREARYPEHDIFAWVGE